MLLGWRGSCIVVATLDEQRQAFWAATVVARLTGLLETLAGDVTAVAEHMRSLRELGADTLADELSEMLVAIPLVVDGVNAVCARFVVC